MSCGGTEGGRHVVYEHNGLLPGTTALVSASSATSAMSWLPPAEAKSARLTGVNRRPIAALRPD